MQLIFRIKGVLPFAFFNVVLSSIDVLSDLATYFSLLPNNPRWARLTLTWMFAPFCVHTAFYLVKKARGRCKTCVSCQEFFVEFFDEAAVHLPLISSFANLVRTGKLYKLKFKTPEFNTRDHKEVETILDAAGRLSQGEVNFEAGPQSTTQV